MNSKNHILKDVLIVGCGDIGVRVARLVHQGGGRTLGLTRSDASAERLKSFGIQPVMGNLDVAASLTELPTMAKLIFYLAPPPGGGSLDTRMRHFCQSIDPQKLPARVVYASTSGVYGDCGGRWVTEETPVKPQTSRAQRRADAESTLQTWSKLHGVPLIILRVTGIYGPGRLPLARIQQGHPVLSEREAPPTNRIHADDLATVCVKAAEKALNGDIFNVSDGQPGTMTQYFNIIADLLNLPRPPQVNMAEAKQIMNPVMLSYLMEARRMSNQKMVEKLGVVLRYQDLESGLNSAIAQINQPNMGYLGSIGH